MTQVYIIAGLIVLVGILICVVFIRQTLVKKQKEKARLHRALEKRAKELIQMLNAFPQHFLPRDLQVFLYRCIVDTFEQLSKLDPSAPEYIENFKAYTTHMEAAMRQPAEPKDITLQSTVQINEIRQFLNILGKFLQRWLQRGNISQKQYGHYKDLLKRLVNKLMIDNYILSAKQAVQIEKPKLAVHYYTLGKNLLTKSGGGASKKETIEFINSELEQLNKQIAEMEPVEQPQEQEEESEKQWKQFEENDDWKKKNIYD